MSNKITETILDAGMLKSLILQALPEAKVEIDDLRGDGEVHYAAFIAAPEFAGRTRIDQHRLVYAALRGHWDPDKQPLVLRTAIIGE